jgi:hypothetical protein
MDTHYPPATVTDAPAETVPELRYQLFYRSLTSLAARLTKPDLDPTHLELKTMVRATDLQTVSFSTASPIDPGGEVTVELDGTVTLDQESVAFGHLDALVAGGGASPNGMDGTTLTFEAAETGLTRGDTAYLRGATTDGTPVFGSASVNYTN